MVTGSPVTVVAHSVQVAVQVGLGIVVNSVRVTVLMESQGGVLAARLGRLGVGVS